MKLLTAQEQLLGKKKAELTIVNEFIADKT